MKLNQSKVIFSPEQHTYYLGDKKLSGISHLYGKHINPDKYSNIPESVLAKAAERGNKTHSMIEEYDMLGVGDGVIIDNYAKIKSANNLTVLESEYLVSDNTYFATQIDKVINQNGELCIGDLKTTYVLDEDSLSWQLSICAYLFELQNPNLKVQRLYGIWLRDEKSKFIEVQRIDTAIVENLLYCDVMGLPFVVEKTALPTSVNEALLKLSELETIIQVTKSELESKEKDLDTLKAFLLSEMQTNSVKKWETDNIVITFVEQSERVTIDSKRMKEESPELYKKYSKTSIVKPNIKIKLK